MDQAVSGALPHEHVCACMCLRSGFEHQGYVVENLHVNKLSSLALIWQRHPLHDLFLVHEPCCIGLQPPVQSPHCLATTTYRTPRMLLCTWKIFFLIPTVKIRCQLLQQDLPALRRVLNRTVHSIHIYPLHNQPVLVY